jgi:hypothetical protein
MGSQNRVTAFKDSLGQALAPHIKEEPVMRSGVIFALPWLYSSASPGPDLT